MMKSRPEIENEQADELVELIDRLMQQGDGRVTVTADEQTQGVRVSTFTSTDCAGTAKGACCQPNEKIDEETDDLQKG